jgi:predicted SAM-dependent methyltransferase
MNFIFLLVLDKINSFLLTLKKNKKYNLKQNQIGINIGCELNTISELKGIDGSLLIYLLGSRFIPVFLKKKIYSKTFSNKLFNFKRFKENLENLDIIHYNICYGIPFEKDSIPYIFSSHFLEHLDKKEGESFIRECYRVLKPGGKIRILVPDIDTEIRNLENDLRVYKKTRDVDVVQEYFKKDLRIGNRFSFHRRMYNFEELKKTLGKAGFVEIEKKKVYEGDFPFLKKLDIRESLIVQAVKT